MKKYILSIVLPVFLIGNIALGSGMKPGSGEKIRKPAVAGKFYPADPLSLEKTVRFYLEDAAAPAGEKPIAIISPHAGYIYSGQISADAFNQAKGHDYRLIVLLGVNHTTQGFAGVSIYSGGGYETPLGTAYIDEEAARELAAASKDFTYFGPVHKKEHSIEVQLPFVQKIFPDAKILPAIIGVPDPDLCARFGKALARVIKNRQALIVASSDLSHYPSYEDAVRVDKKTLGLITKMDIGTLPGLLDKQLKRAKNLSTCACGLAPVLAAMTAAKELGANCGKIISYANSGDVSVGNRDRVVGYGAVAFYAECKESGQKDKSPVSIEGVIGRSHKIALLSFARNTLRQFMETRTTPLARGFDPVLENKQGAFVTLKKNGKLRGCIGHMAEDMPLCQVVGTMALQAAFNDRRFSPVTAAELTGIEIEISVLTPFKKIAGPGEIRVGRDGVVIEKNGRSAVFLPQVAPEQGWNRDQMLEHLCVKAGLSANSWKKGAEFHTFQAEVFSESEFK